MVDSESGVTATVIYNPHQNPSAADTDAVLHQWIETKMLQQQSRPEVKGYHIQAGSTHMRTVGGHPAISFIGEYTVQGHSLIDYNVRVLGKSTQAEIRVFNSAENVADFCKRFDLMVDSLRIP